MEKKYYKNEFKNVELAPACMSGIEVKCKKCGKDIKFGDLIFFEQCKISPCNMDLERYICEDCMRINGHDRRCKECNRIIWSFECWYEGRIEGFESPCTCYECENKTEIDTEDKDAILERNRRFNFPEWHMYKLVEKEVKSK